MERTYFCIDMKCFYASVECAERGLNPFDTPLVVADESRGKGALCLAISPKLKALGVKNRCRTFEIPRTIKYIVAKPRMKKYIEYAADIYDIYLDYFSPDDIYVYSIDEAFIDATGYLNKYNKTPTELARLMIDEIARRRRIPATAGVGTNLYLAKVALDITAKHTREHIGFLDEERFCRELGTHRPITDFWGISHGSAARLAKYGIYDMAGIRNMPTELMYRIFGINGEIVVDHAWGKEPCTIADIKAYQPRSKSVSSSQILFEDYTYDKAWLVLKEMTLGISEELIRRGVIAGNVGIYVGYSRDLCGASGGSVSMTSSTNVYSVLLEYVEHLYRTTTDRNTPIRRLGITASAIADTSAEGYDLFCDPDAIEKEKRIADVVLGIKERFGKNAVLRGFDFEDGATAIIRNKLIGGHNGE